MANKKISGLTPASAINDSDKFEIAQSGTSKGFSWVSSVLSGVPAVFANTTGLTLMVIVYGNPVSKIQSEDVPPSP